MKRWRLLPHDPPAIERLGRALNVSPVLAQLLLNRGVAEADGARLFLSAPLSGLHDPETLSGATEAARRIHQAVRDGRRICIYGDYDVDGVTGTTVLWRCLQLAGAQVEFYVPHRLEEGYGLNCEALRSLARSGVHMVVTVDCGIGSLTEAEEARKLGLELIVTDHHEFKSSQFTVRSSQSAQSETANCELRAANYVLPDAAVLIHPRLPDSQYPFPQLCGAGVAFKLAWAICQQFSQAKKVSEQFKQFLLESVALVALGSVADVVPLTGENRIFVRHGLKILKHAPTTGLRALLQSADLAEKRDLDAADIAFNLAPRLNAVGRLGQARLAVELLASTSEQRAADLARYLNDQNERRQQIERRMLHEAREMVESDPHLMEAPALVLASPEWHAGVVGIVAGRLADRYGRPALMISLKEEPGQGSGRSIPGFHLLEALAACGDLLLAYGGHAAAAGFRIAAGQVDAFRQRFCEQVAFRLHGCPSCPTLTIDAEVPLSAMTVGLMRGIAALHPHGEGNTRPLFLVGGLQLMGEPRRVGGGERHLQFRVRQEEGPIMRAIAFGMAEHVEELISTNGQCCLVFTPRLNEWQGYLSVDLEVCDFQPGSAARLG